MASNADIEMRWIDAWNDVYHIIGPSCVGPCQLPDWSIVSVEECLEWLQESVSEGYSLALPLD